MKKAAAIPDVVVHVTPRLVSNDCATWALKILTGRSYPEIRAQAEKVDKKAGEQGLWWHQVKRMAKALGVKLAAKRPVNIDEDAGLLSVKFKNGEYHAVILMQGPVILDADNTVWYADDYLAAKGCKPTSILRIEGEDK